jgi:hypothetical protein
MEDRMVCPKCNKDTFGPDTSPGSPPRTYSCPCGFIYYNYKAPAPDKQTPNARYDVKARIRRMLQMGCTDEHIMECIDLKKNTLIKYMCDAKKELKIPATRRRIS